MRVTTERLFNMRISVEDEELLNRLSTELKLSNADTIRFALRSFELYEELKRENQRILEGYRDQGRMIEGMVQLLTAILATLPPDHNDPKIKAAFEKYQHDYGKLFVK